MREGNMFLGAYLDGLFILVIRNWRQGRSFLARKNKHLMPCWSFVYHWTICFLNSIVRYICKQVCSLVVVVSLVAPQDLGLTPRGSEFIQAWVFKKTLLALCCTSVRSYKDISGLQMRPGCTRADAWLGGAFKVFSWSCSEKASSTCNTWEWSFNRVNFFLHKLHHTEFNNCIVFDE
jgi:hypothetical protein